MKTSRLLLASVILAATATLLTAGPGPQYWNRPVVPKAPAPATIAPATIATTPAAPAATTSGTCECCKKNQ